jgi:Protein of unknown function (DUF1350)
MRIRNSAFLPLGKGGTDRAASRCTIRIPKAFDSAISASTSSVFEEDQLESTSIGDWEALHGNYILRPPLDQGPPRALLHFLGGAIVGSGPHVSYRYLLERFAAQGYIVVATPYSLSFDHLSTCDAVIDRFERVAPLLARTYGALPVVGIGHSCGALLQVLITSLFPDTPRAANALLSYNNKPVGEAIPVFEEVVVPFFTYVAARNDTSRPSGSQLISTGLELAISAVSGTLPSDELLSKAANLLTPPRLRSSGRSAQDDESGDSPSIRIPPAVRDAYAALVQPSRTLGMETGAIPVLTEVLESLEQVPRLIDEVADGYRDFVPPPKHVRSVVQRAYRARRTLIVRYQDDAFDESDDIEELLNVASQVIRMRRPMIPIDLQRRDLAGFHATPLLAPPLDVAKRAETLLGIDAARETLQYAQTEQTVSEIVQWLGEGNL